MNKDYSQCFPKGRYYSLYFLPNSLDAFVYLGKVKHAASPHERQEPL